MKTFDQKLNEYAKLITSIGIGVVEGKDYTISCPVEAVDFGRKLVDNAYALGAAEVSLYWYDDYVTRKKYENAPLSSFQTFPQWLVERRRYDGERGAGSIGIISSNPELLKGIDSKKIEANNKSSNEALKDVMKYSMNDIISWCVAAIPSKAWAEKVFPDKKCDEAVGALWEAIFAATRINEEDPVAAWEEHIKNLSDKSKALNDYSFDHLLYKSSNGTNLKVGLPKGHIWISGDSYNAREERFVANLPTEEVFTAPDARRVDGELHAVKPLVYGGNLIEDFWFKFEGGKVVEYHAEKGEEYLKDLIESDEFSNRLGEVALVPVDSPISNSGVLFYNTLFDENASCHFAFGQAYPTCVKGGENMKEEELDQLGINNSSVHSDFMVGAKDLSIIGVTEEGKEVEIFKNGNWAF